MLESLNARKSTQQVLTRVPQPPRSLLTQTVDKAQEAFESWKLTSLLSRQGILLK
jgi:malonate-semialdehyde dehydrogenase (acetylating)/methylmalonate-semialdehyde dehydrogenase